MAETLLDTLKKAAKRAADKSRRYAAQADKKNRAEKERMERTARKKAGTDFKTHKTEAMKRARNGEKSLYIDLASMISEIELKGPVGIKQTAYGARLVELFKKNELKAKLDIQRCPPDDMIPFTNYSISVTVSWE